MCFPDELNPVAVTIDLIDVFYTIPRNETIESSVVVIDGNFSSKAIQKYYPRHPSFVLSGNSIDTLKAILLEVKSAEIWNVKSLFLIIGTQCQDSAQSLKLLWEIEAVASFFICRDDAINRTMIYTFNPYCNYVPRPWRRVEIDREPENQWTLFRQPFSNDPTICQSIKFDKSKHLNGFPIRSAFQTHSGDEVIIGKIPPIIYKPLLRPMSIALFKNLESISNSTPVLYMGSHLNSITDKRKYDLQMSLVLLKSLKNSNFNFLSFYNQDGYVIVTNKQSTVLVINQIVENYFNVWTASISCIILILILIVIYINNNQNLREALLDMLALFIDMDLMVPLNRISMKIAFFSATLFFLMFNPAIQSQVTSHLTKPVPQQIDTLADLYQNKFQVKYVESLHEELLSMGLWSNESDQKYLHGVRYLYPNDCEAFLKKPSTACIMRTHQLPNYFPDEYHLSKYLYFSEYVGHVSRRNWPLKDKFDKAVMNFVEAGNAEFFERQSTFKQMLRYKKLIDRIEANEEYDQLDFGYFDFDYIWIPLSLFWTILVLIIEIMHKRLKDWNEKRLRELRFKKSQAREVIACAIKQMAGVPQNMQNV
ncbi:GSCOCG00005046001-RA-CDS [Cotesia congregata]|nr:GSCOCG00005046001-RA-CDS [Cotesia congregata]